MDFLKSLAVATLLFLSFISFRSFAGNLTDEEARSWCDNNAIHQIEGIWEYPDDNTRVLIQADKNVPGAFSMTVLSSPDCRMATGDIIGRLYPSVDAKQFRLRHVTRKNNLNLSDSQDCAAILSSDGEAIRVKATKIKFKINPSVLLPKFWRIVRFSIDNPTDDLPAGLVKLYPGYDRNGSLHRKIRIL